MDAIAAAVPLFDAPPVPRSFTSSPLAIFPALSPPAFPTAPFSSPLCCPLPTRCFFGPNLPRSLLPPSSSEVGGVPNVAPGAPSSVVPTTMLLPVPPVVVEVVVEVVVGAAGRSVMLPCMGSRMVSSRPSGSMCFAASVSNLPGRSCTT